MCNGQTGRSETADGFLRDVTNPSHPLEEGGIYSSKLLGTGKGCPKRHRQHGVAVPVCCSPSGCICIVIQKIKMF